VTQFFILKNEKTDTPCNFQKMQRQIEILQEKFHFTMVTPSMK